MRLIFEIISWSISIYDFISISHDRSPSSENCTEDTAEASKLDYNMGGPRGIKHIPDSRNIMTGIV